MPRLNPDSGQSLELVIGSSGLSQSVGRSKLLKLGIGSSRLLKLAMTFGNSDRCGIMVSLGSCENTSNESRSENECKELPCVIENESGVESVRATLIPTGQSQGKVDGKSKRCNK